MADVIKVEVNSAAGDEPLGTTHAPANVTVFIATATGQQIGGAQAEGKSDDESE
jgi:hypothetical protein